MNQYWSDVVYGLLPYVAGEQPKSDSILKLNSNESPFPPAPGVLQAIQNAIPDNLQKYPNINADNLRHTVAQYYGLSADQVFVGNGSDEVLAFSFMGLFSHLGKKVLFPDITYSFYPVYAKLFKIDFQTIALDDQYRIQIDDYCKVSAKEVSTILFPNPNAPTGIALEVAAIERLLQAQPDILIAVDEAYVDFGAQTVVGLVQKYSNLIVFQTLSKSRSLAGLRVGFAFAQADLLQALIRVKDSFNSYPVDRLAQAGAAAAFTEQDYFEKTCKLTIETRDFLSAELAKLGFEVLPSKTNFVFVSHPQHSAMMIFDALRARKILVRHFNLPRCESFLRITVGLQEDCEKLIRVLKEVL